MPAITLEVSEPVAAQLRLRHGQTGQILERGLRAVEVEGELGYQSASEVLECLARLPEPAEVLALRAAPSMQQRVQELIERERDGKASSEELIELEHYVYLDHLVRMAKAHARSRLVRE